MDQAKGVFIVDDDAGYRSVAAAVVEATDGFELMGTEGDADQAVRRLTQDGQKPDLVLMDVNLGAASGLDATRAVTATNPTMRVILVSTLAIEDLPGTAITCGAAGYLLKSLFSPTTLEQMQSGLYDWAR